MNNIFVTHDMHGMTIYAVNQHRENCYGTQHLAYVPDVPPTEEQLAEMAREEAAYEAAMRDHYGTGYEEAMAQQEPNGWQYGFYKTEEAARRATQLHAHMNSVGEDIRAWGAPSECYGLACRSDEKELEKLDQEFGTHYHVPNPWLERGCIDRRTAESDYSWKLAGERHDDIHKIVCRRVYRPEPVPESVDECEYGDEEYQWRLKQAGL